MGFHLAIAILWAAAATIGWAAAIQKSRSTCHSLDALLVNILEGEDIGTAPLQENSLSLLSLHVSAISDKLSLEISRASQEKEQVKQLISNMSHQLKTPLANLAMYEELLAQDGLTSQQKAVLMEKLRVQTEKLDWLLHSLFKMSRLEQNVITFEAGAAGIKETLQHAIGTVFHKAEKKGIEIRVTPFPNVPLFPNPKWAAGATTMGSACTLGIKSP